LRDVTESKKREKKLREAHEKLLEHDKSRSDFVFNVSHELKTPLASMSYAIDNMLKGIVGELSESAISYIGMVKEDVERLSQTVGDILDLSRIEANTFKLDKVKIPLRRLLERTVRSLQLQAEENCLDLTFDSDIYSDFIECDPRKMERVIINIIRNAIKFTPAHGYIKVVLCSNPHDENMLCISITDSGIGIPKEHIHKVTERYFRVGEHVEGTGLGLAISKDIIELHGGSLVVASPPKNMKIGTGVYLSVPKCKPPLVMVVDDDDMARDIICRHLERHGYNSKTCRNGAEALDCLEVYIPDVIITDLVMPVLDGVAMIAEIKIRSEWRHIPVVAVTGGELSQAKREILEGFDIPALAKPYDCRNLLDIIEKTIFGMHYLHKG
jgi:CheY-like chemotaxis protein